MTQQQYDTLKKYERQILTAYKANYYVGLAPNDIKSIYEAFNQLHPNQKENYTTCNACVLKVLKKLYPDLPKEENKAEEPKKEVKKPKKQGKKKNEEGNKEG